MMKRISPLSLFNNSVILKNNSVIRIPYSTGVTGGEGKRGDDGHTPSMDQIRQSGMRYLKNVKSLKENIKLRNMNLDIDNMVYLKSRYGKINGKIDDITNKQNTWNRNIKTIKDKTERDELLKTMRELKTDKQHLKERELEPLERQLTQLVSALPNYIHPQTPVGDYDNARIVETCNNKPEFSFKPLDHIKLGKALDLFDFQAGAETTGYSYYYLKGQAALMEIALIQYAMQKAVKKGYTPIITPDVVKTDVVERCGFQPRSEATQVYSLDPSKHGHLSLSGTAEIPLADKFILHENLPIKLVAFGRCYRAEAERRNTLYRVHQFSKVELFGVTADEENGQESASLLEEMVSLQKEINTELGFHYRVLDMPTHELGAPAYRKYDIEVWMPGMGRYGEVTSASNCTDYQSRRFNITYSKHPIYRVGKKRLEKRKYVHTLNATACAIPRTIVALLENYQREDGSVELPHVVKHFMS